MSVPEHPLHFGPGTSITTPLKSKGLGFGLSWSCILKYANSRGCGNVVIPQGFPKSVGRVESRFLGFPCFPYSVISMACFGNARRTIKIPKRPGLGTGTVFFSRIFLPSGPLARACSGSVTGHRCEHVICCGPGATGSRNSALANPHSEWEAIGRLWRFSAKPKNPPRASRVETLTPHILAGKEPSATPDSTNARAPSLSANSCGSGVRRLARSDFAVMVLLAPVFLAWFMVIS